jgi:hypothetical protein
VLYAWSRVPKKGGRQRYTLCVAAKVATASALKVVLFLSLAYGHHRHVVLYRHGYAPPASSLGFALGANRLGGTRYQGSMNRSRVVLGRESHVGLCECTGTQCYCRTKMKMYLTFPGTYKITVELFVICRNRDVLAAQPNSPNSPNVRLPMTAATSQHTMASTMLQMLPSGGPLFVLQWSGRLCPCLEKDEDRNARQALQSLRSCSNARILWKTGTSASLSGSGTGGGGSGGVGAGFLSSLFQGAVGGVGGGGSGSSASVPARFVVQDDENGEPEFFVDPIPEDATEANSASGDDASHSPQAPPFRRSGSGSKHDRPSTSSVGYKLHVLVRRVDRVTLEGNDVVLLAKKLDPQQPAKQLLRFELLSTSASNAPATTEQRNLAVHHLSVLVEWERQRRIGMGYHDGNGNYCEEEDDDQPNFLAARAQKAAHFARRELELQQTRRDREKRKAKLVQETGGLKYTALAMASRGESA